MRYKAYDYQNHKYMFDGFAFRSKKSLIDQLISFFSVDHDEQELRMVKEDLENGDEYADIGIETMLYYKKIKLDNFFRDRIQDVDNNIIYTSVDGKWYSICKIGEPDCPLKDGIKFVEVKNEN